MRRFLLSATAGLLTMGGLTLFTASAQAQNPYQDPYHDQLEHRGYHRDLQHQDAHRYPMTWGQHGQVHQQLGHEAYHDRLEHRQIDGQQYGSPYQGYSYPRSPGIGYQGRNFSFYLGR